jgi:hypothetical protein
LLFSLALAGVTTPLAAQDPALIPDSRIAIPSLEFDNAGGLIIQPSAASSQHDFD